MTSLQKKVLREKVRERYLLAETVRCLEHRDVYIKDGDTRGLYRPNLKTVRVVTYEPHCSEVEVRCDDLDHKTVYILLYIADEDKYAPIIEYKKRKITCFDDSKKAPSDTFLDDQLTNYMKRL